MQMPSYTYLSHSLYTEVTRYILGAQRLIDFKFDFDSIFNQFIVIWLYNPNTKKMISIRELIDLFLGQRKCEQFSTAIQKQLKQTVFVVMKAIWIQIR